MFKKVAYLNDIPNRELCPMVEWVKVLLELPDPVNVDVVGDLVVVVFVDSAVDAIVVVVALTPSASFDVLNRPAEPNSHRL